MTIVNTATVTLSAEKATEIMSAMITAGNFSPETYKAACEAYLAVITPPPAPEAVKKERKQRAPNKPGSQQGWCAGVTRDEYSAWLASLPADYTGPRNSYECKRVRELNAAMASLDSDENISDSENSNEAVNPPGPPAAEEIQPDDTDTDTQAPDLATIVALEEQKHTALAGNIKPGVSKKNKSK
jgi:hypothetical protein